MDQADSGEVWLYDTQIVSLDEDDKADIRLNRMGFVFQQMNMLSNLNIIDNIAFPAVFSAMTESMIPKITNATPIANDSFVTREFVKPALSGLFCPIRFTSSKHCYRTILKDHFFM